LNDWLVDIICGEQQPRSNSAIQLTSAPPPAGFEGAGYGRKVEFVQPVAVNDLVRRLAAGLGRLKHVMVAAPKHFDVSAAAVQSVAVCAGSGWDIIKSCPVDVLVTGEMSHHNALRATMEGKLVITVFHSNSERAYLRQRMLPALEAELRRIGAEAQVLVSEEDKDPFAIWDVERLGAVSAPQSANGAGGAKR
jgi:putative NIF3 family GTP cyclohydrolase 1 type 2